MTETNGPTPETFGQMEARIRAEIAAQNRPHELAGIHRALSLVLEAARDAERRFVEIDARLNRARGPEVDDPGPDGIRHEHAAAFTEMAALREAAKTIGRIQSLKRREG